MRDISKKKAEKGGEHVIDKKEKTAGSSMEAGQTKLCLFLGAFKLQK